MKVTAHVYALSRRAKRRCEDGGEGVTVLVRVKSLRVAPGSTSAMEARTAALSTSAAASEGGLDEVTEKVTEATAAS